MGARVQGVALAVALIAGSFHPSHAADTPVLGGPGGGPVSIPCNDNERLIGVGARYGAWLDWVGPICVPVSPDMGWSGIPRGNVYVPARKKSVFEQVGTVWASFLPWNLPDTLGPKIIEGTYVPGMGGDGGGFISFLVCPEHFMVYGFDATVVGGKNLVARLALRCRNPQTGDESWVALPPPTPIDLPYYNLTGGNCPVGEMASGIHGRSGVFVDSFGLSCRATPSRAFCQGYTDQAMAQANDNLRRSCGYEGPRWTTDAAAHLNWCMALGGDQNPPNLESAARAQQLRDCKPRLAAVLRAPGDVLTTTRNVRLAVTKIPGAAPVAPPTPEPAPAPTSYALTCVGGGAMTARTDNGVTIITFAPGTQGSAAAAPAPGQCTWSDRGFRPGEPGVLTISDPALAGQTGNLARATTGGGVFRVMAYNNGQGTMMVTGIDLVVPPLAAAAPPNPPAGTATAVVNADVDMYDTPGGTGRVIGILRQGDRVPLLACQADNWCQIQAEVHPQPVWVWGDFLDR